MTGDAHQQPRFTSRIPEGEDRARRVCETCGFIDYVNPKIVVGSVVLHEGKVLMCRRAIEPRRGFWTLPAGFMEENETVEEAAMREAMEEAQAEIRIESMLAVYSIPRISQVQIMFRAGLAKPHFAPGPESLEVRLMEWSDIPWADLAFPSVKWALDHIRAYEAGAPAPFTNP
jgi:ADP-ribose pyrophosphatase YjhB (NUDIX family)